MNLTTQTIRSLDLKLGSGRRVVPIALSETSLVLSVGWGEGEEFHGAGWDALPLVLPADVLPRLRDSLGLGGDP